MKFVVPVVGLPCKNVSANGTAHKCWTTSPLWLG